MLSKHVSNSTNNVPKSGLSPNVVVFVPTRHQQKTYNSISLKELQISLTPKAVATAINSSISATYNLTPTNILHALVSHDMDNLRELGNLRNNQVTHVSGFNPTESFGVDMAHIFFEEGEEEELLDNTFANAVRERGLSPRHLRSCITKSTRVSHEIVGMVR